MRLVIAEERSSNMKIAIVTVYDSIVNFGSFLQAYALSKVLESKGHEVFFVRRMENENILNRFNELARVQNSVSFSNNLIKRELLSKKRELVIRREYRANQKRFLCSLKDWETVKLINPNEIEENEIQLIICGSDEIWNKHNADIDLKFYSCGWAKKTPKIAYAISSGNSKMLDFLSVTGFIDAIGDFNTVLPRDRMTQKLIEDITGIKEEIVCDPTVLLGSNGFAITNKGRKLGKYLLIYSYYLTNKEKKYIKRYAKMRGLKIISPCIYSNIADEIIYTSALDFPSLIFNAECVYTTTFHGTIFALMFAKKMCCLPRLPKIIDILEQINAMEYTVNSDFSYENLCAVLDKRIDKNKINSGLNSLKMKSEKKLDESISRIEEVGYQPLGVQCKNRKKYYYGYSIQENVRNKSSSGGIFYELAQIILAEDGVVFGAYYDKKSKQVIHQSTESVAIDDLLRSKYVESKLGDTYKQIEHYLKDRKKVLFCGTPCQAAGLYYLREKKWSIYKGQLYIVDFLCEGVPSGKIFREYLCIKEKQVGQEIKDVNFRSKAYGWNVHCMKINYENGISQIKPSFMDSYMHTFIMDLVMNRKSCYECAFRENKKSDITIGDFWRIRNVDNSFTDNKGVSAIFVNSEIGENLISCIKHSIYIKKLEEKYWYQMEQLLDTSAFVKRREAFYNEFLNSGYDSAVKKYSTYFNNMKIVKKLKFLRIWNRLEKERKHNTRREK